MLAGTLAVVLIIAAATRWFLLDRHAAGEIAASNFPLTVFICIITAAFGTLLALMLTIRRLRTLGAPGLWSLLLLIPILNLALVGWLLVARERPRSRAGSERSVEAGRIA